MANDYELLEKLHCLIQEAQTDAQRTLVDKPELGETFAEMYEIVEYLREKQPQAPWNEEK